MNAILKHRGPFASRGAWLGAAVGLAIVITAAVFLWVSGRSTPPRALVEAALAESYPAPPAVQSPSNDTDYGRAFELYRRRNYVQASLFFEKAATDHTDPATITFYHGLSALYSGHHKRAEKHLASRVVSTSRYAQQARWYLSLAYLKAGNTATAVTLLDQIAIAPHHFKYEDALGLLKALKRE